MIKINTQKLKSINRLDAKLYHHMYGGKYDGWTSITIVSDFDNVVSTTKYTLLSNYINYVNLMDSMTIIKVGDD